MRPRSQPDDATLASHPTVRLVDRLLAEAMQLDASDLHVAPCEHGGLARARVDGAFREIARLTPEDLPRVIGRLKVMAGLSAFRTAEPQDGSLRAGTGAEARDARLATLPVVGGEHAVVRFLDRRGSPREMGDLGWPDATLAEVRRLLAQPAGCLVVAGPCSSGKTTTLHAMVRHLIATRGEATHVVSVEDPVEQVIPGVAQAEVDVARGLTFARALTAMLRQDPNVLVVGETRDPETARVAIEAAFTGHLVLTSLHVASASEALRRLELMGVPSWQARAALRGVISQRLVRRTCAACAGSGCEACAGAGHRGRFAIAAVEALEDGEPRLLTPSLPVALERAVTCGLTTRVEASRVLGEDATS